MSTCVFVGHLALDTPRLGELKVNLDHKHEDGTAAHNECYQECGTSAYPLVQETFHFLSTQDRSTRWSQSGAFQNYNVHRVHRIKEIALEVSP